MVSSRVSLVFAIVAIFALIATAVPLTSNQFASLLAACKATGWNGAHADCATINTWDTSQITDMSSLFRDERTFNLNIGAWNTGSVTDMSNMFYGAFAFNQDISGWDVSSVTSMQQMFMRPSVINSDSQFNQPLSSWDVSKVTNMNGMFYAARNFNGDVSQWDVRAVTTMSNMFREAFRFNQDISAWVPSSVTTASWMFASASGFNQNIDSWNVASLVQMDNMFRQTSRFNQPIDSWDVSKVTDMSSVFYSSAYNQNLASWNTASVQDMSYMFRSSRFNFPIQSWDVTSVTNFDGMFQFAYAFNQPIGAWTLSSSPITMNFMFNSASGFQQNLTGWDTSTVTAMNSMFESNSNYNIDLVWDTSRVTTMARMFMNARSFNANVSGFDTSQVSDMSEMFRSASSFNGAIGVWDTSKVTDFARMFQDAAVFNQSLSEWDTSSAQTLSYMFSMDTAGANLFNDDISRWDMSAAVDLSGMFSDASLFNVDISRWDVSKVTNMDYMFSETPLFNVDLDAWDVRAVTSMRGMFRYTKIFNQDLASWQLNSLTVMDYMFQYAESYNGAVGVWDTSTVTSMNGVFAGTKRFNQSLSTWDTSSCLSMSAMFSDSFFNGEIGVWDTSKVTNMASLFSRAVKFNQSLSTWDTSSCETMSYMFSGAVLFNGDISGWDTSKAISLSGMFRNAEAFDIPIGGWNTGLVEQISSMFDGAAKFNQDLPWDTSQVEYMTSVFQQAYAFNGDVSGWNTAKVTSLSSVFSNATAFNRPIGGWNTALVEWTQYCFRDATSFNQDLAWDMSLVRSMSYMFSGASAFNGNIASWSTSAVESMDYMFAGASSFNRDISQWNTIAVRRANFMFYNATKFNQDIGGWNTAVLYTTSSMFAFCDDFSGGTIGQWATGTLQSADYMFYGCLNFNADLSGWDVSRVSDMQAMFYGALNFNADLSGWTTSSVRDTSYMFAGAKSFGQDAAALGWDTSRVTDDTNMFKYAAYLYDPLYAGTECNASLPVLELATARTDAHCAMLAAERGCNMFMRSSRWPAYNYCSCCTSVPAPAPGTPWSIYSSFTVVPLFPVITCPALTVPPASGELPTITDDCSCVRGYSGPNSTACAACEPGTYKNVTGQTPCAPCPFGTYLNETEGTSCLPCPATGTAAPPGSDAVSDCGCAINFEGAGWDCSPCASGTYKGELGDGVCTDVDECAAAGARVVASYVDAPGLPAWNTGVAADAAVDGVTTGVNANPWTDRDSCDDIAYILLDMGMVVGLKNVTYFARSDRQYCNQRVEVSISGAFVGEQTVAFGCGDFAECGALPESGRVVPLNAPGRYVRVGMSKNQFDSRVNLLEIIPTFTTDTCAKNQGCSNTNGSFVCVSCPETTVGPVMWTNLSGCVCDVGFTGPAGAACMACEAGTFKDETGSAQCQLCAAGSYRSLDSLTASAQTPTPTPTVARRCDLQADALLAGHDCAVCQDSQALYLDGVGDVVDLAEQTWGPDVSFSAFVKAEAAPDSGTLFDFGNGPWRENQVVAFSNTSGRLRFRTYNNGSQAYNFSSWADLHADSAALPLNQWVHVAATINGTLGTLYVDGVQVSTGSVWNLNRDGAFARRVGYLGGSSFSPAQNWQGWIADFRVYARALSAAEVSAVNGGDYAGLPDPILSVRESCGLQVDGRACSACPANTSSRAGSDALLDCICNAGYSGPDGGLCTACGPGSFKAVNGSSECGSCASGTYLNTSAGTECIHCPAGNLSNSLPGSVDVEACVCLAGYSGPDGGHCVACGPGSFKAVNGSSKCVSCAAGTYLNTSAGSKCAMCPANTISLARSHQIAECICNIGYEGMDGSACRACSGGSYKAVNGSGSCMSCEAGTYAEASGGSACLSCPNNTHSAVGSDAILDCVCNGGYAGVDGARCAACDVGTFKPLNGSGECVACDAGQFQSATAATFCDACELDEYSPPRSGHCYLADAKQRFCYDASFTLDAMCPERELEVRGCATNVVEFQEEVLQASDSRVDLGRVSIQCLAFYTWACEELGGLATDVPECDFYCRFFSGLRDELSAGCGAGTECQDWVGRPTWFNLQPAAGSFCPDAARYALFSSCSVPTSRQELFAANVEAFIASGADQSSCHSTSKREELVVSGGAAPPVAASPDTNFDCYDRTDCRYACFNHGFAIVYAGSLVTLTSNYQGTCDCAVRGSFAGHVQFAGSLAVQARNALNETLTLSPVSVFNQVMMMVNSTDGVCSFAQDFEQGTMLGLPTAASMKPSPKGELSFVGYEAALSGSGSSNAISQRRRLLQTSSSSASEFAAECPQQSGDCRFECLSTGMQSEAYGTELFLTPKYEGSCDCGEVLVQGTAAGEPVLRGQVYLTDSGDLGFSYPNAFFPAFVPGADPAAVTLDADLAPLEAGSLLLKVDGACAYRMGVAAGKLDMIRAALAKQIAVANAEQDASITLVRTALGTSCAGLAQDCAFTCMFSGLTKVTPDLTIIGVSPSAACSCPTHASIAGATRIEAEAWTIEADFAANALAYSYRAPTVPPTNCSGFLNVTGGTFLGIPRGALYVYTPTTPIPGDESSSQWNGPPSVTVRDAERVAEVMTTVIASTVGIAVCAAVATSVSTSIASATAVQGVMAGAGAGAGAASGAAAVSLVTQLQTTALTARIGGPGAQPESTRALSGGLEWANFHIFKLWRRSDESASSSSSRRVDTGKKAGAEEENPNVNAGTVEISDASFIRTCEDAKHSSRELASTMLAAALGVGAASLARAFFNAVITAVARRNGHDPDRPALPFLSWEVQVFLLQYQGIAEAAGEAISSRCFEYEVAGAAVLLLLLLLAAAVLLVVVWAIRKRVILWSPTHVGLKGRVSGPFSAFRESQGQPFVSRVRVTYAAFVAFDYRGEWEPSAASKEKEARGNDILERIGAFFDGSTGKAWWYGFWCLLRVLAQGIILSSVMSSSFNVGAFLGLNTLDSLFLLFTRPQVEWMSFIQETYKVVVNLATMGAIFSYISEQLPENWFSNLFVWLSVASVVPAVIASLLGPIVKVLSTVRSCVGRCGGLLQVQDIGVAAGAVSGIAAMARQDDGMHDQMLGAMEKRQQEASREAPAAYGQPPEGDHAGFYGAASGAYGAIGGGGAREKSWHPDGTALTSSLVYLQEYRDPMAPGQGARAAAGCVTARSWDEEQDEAWEQRQAQYQAALEEWQRRAHHHLWRHGDQLRLLQPAERWQLRSQSATSGSGTRSQSARDEPGSIIATNSVPLFRIQGAATHFTASHLEDWQQRHPRPLLPPQQLPGDLRWNEEFLA